MDNVPLEEIKPSFQEILDITSCAICLETVRPEIVHCINGHLLCGECRQGLKNCPTCSQPFSTAELSLVLRQILEALPKRCQYTNCKTYLKHDEDHEKWCGHQPTSCKIRNCTWTGPGRDILLHVRDKHSTVYVFEEKSEKVRFHGFDFKDNAIRVLPISAHGQFFWGEVNCDHDKEMLAITYNLVPNGKPTEDYFIEMSFKSEEYLSHSKFKFDFEKDKTKNSVFVHKHWLPSFINEEQILRSSLFITTRKH
uniref:RING-type domain-containing protein n=1 Tax=Graphocephala atropunctata TaxID=36148 RepID=A0A1B6MAS8_9HEMI